MYKYSILWYWYIIFIGCGPLDATNALKHLINQSEERIFQIDQLKNALNHLLHQMDRGH